jgi:enoyl-CoA hydratase/carnithine racemase
MRNSTLLIDAPVPGVRRILLNRVDKRNAIDYATREDLIDALTAIGTTPSVRAVVFGGAGGFFSAGGDTPSMVGLSEAEARGRMQHIHRLCRLLATLPLPVVTAIEGMGVGAGMGLALLGDVIVVGRGTKVYFPFLKLGLIPDWGSLLTLPRRIGLPAAQRLLAESATVEGPEAYRLSIADVLVDDAEVMTTAIAKALELSRLPLGAFARMKSLLQQHYGSLEQTLRAEEDAQAVLLRSHDFAEGYAAMREKRPANFVPAHE